MGNMAMPNKGNVSTEWWISHLRWALLVALLLISTQLLSQTSRFLPVLVVLLAGGLYNLSVVLLLRSNRSFRWFDELTLGLDTVLPIILAFLSVQPSYFLIALFPIVVAGLKFGTEISLLVASLISAAYGGFVFFLQNWLVAGEAMLTTLVTILILFVTAALTGLLGPKARGASPSDAELEVPPSAAYRERFRAIYEMTGELISSLNYQLILEKILDAGLADYKESAQRSLQKPVSMVLFFDEEQDCLYVAASRNLSKTDERKRTGGASGLVGLVLSRGEPAKSSRPGEDAELSTFRAVRRCRSVLCVPLRAGLELFGVALFASPEPEAYGDAYMELITAFCNQASIALQNAELYQNLQEERKRILFSDEELRKQLARELHDGPTQSISSIAMRLDFIRTLLVSDPSKARQELDKLERLAGQAVKEVRTMLFSMRPMVLESQGLAAAVEQYADRIRETDNIHVHVDAGGLSARPVPLVEGATFFILEEAINNAKKHAAPRHIWVNLGSQNDQLFAQVRDDGEGFDIAEVESSYDSRSSLGLVNMRERARLINGLLTIESQPMQGTTVSLTAPMSGMEEIQ
jgi:signal transduction histidine kinase